MSENGLPDIPEFKPAVGDLIMRGHREGETGTCAVVLEVYRNDVGGCMYIIQTTMRLVLLQPPEKLTQHEVDVMGYHPATKDEWLEDWQSKHEYYHEEINRLFKMIEPFVSSDGN